MPFVCHVNVIMTKSRGGCQFQLNVALYFAWYYSRDNALNCLHLSTFLVTLFKIISCAPGTIPLLFFTPGTVPLLFLKTTFCRPSNHPIFCLTDTSNYVNEQLHSVLFMNWFFFPLPFFLKKM